VNDSLRLIRELNGAPLTILILLGLQKEPVNLLRMQNLTGASDKTLARGLGYLYEYGFVRRAGEGWLLSGEGLFILHRLFPVWEADAPARPQPAPDAKAAAPAEAEEGTPVDPSWAEDGPNLQEEAALIPEEDPQNAAGTPAGESRKNSDLCFINTSIKEFIHAIDRKKQKQRPTGPEIFRPPDFQEVDSGLEKPLQEREAIWAELRLAGIRRNARTKVLVEQPYLTAGYVRAHRLAFEALGQTGSKWTGLLITILEGGEPAPAQPDSILCPICSQYPCACEREEE
jgi:hypothetical protein